MVNRIELIGLGYECQHTTGRFDLVSLLLKMQTGWPILDQLYFSVKTSYAKFPHLGEGSNYRPAKSWGIALQVQMDVRVQCHSIVAHVCTLAPNA